MNAFLLALAFAVTAQSAPSLPPVTLGSGGVSTTTLDARYCQLAGCAMVGPVTNTSTTALSLGGNATATPDAVNGGLTIDNDSFTSRVRLLRHSTDSLSPTINMMKSRGTHAAPTAVILNDSFGTISFSGYDGSIFSGGPSIFPQATENYGASAHGSKLLLQTFKNGFASGSGVNQWALGQDGSTSFPGSLSTTQGDFSFGLGALSLGTTGEAGTLNILRSSDGALAAQFSVLPVTEASYLSSTKDFSVFSSGSIRLTVDGPNLMTTSTLPYAFTETTLPAPAAGSDRVAADATSHTLQGSNNGDAFDPFARDVTGFSSQVTASSTAYVDVLSITLTASAKYHCAIDGVFSESVGADGAKVRVNPGATSVTSDAIHGELYDGDTVLGGGVLNSTGSASDTASAGTIVELSDATVTSGHFSFSYNVSTSSAMTWKIQAAQNAHSTGTLTVKAGVTAMCVRM